MKTPHDVLQRLRAEYLEMPGLRLTAEQMQRLCGIEKHMCQSILDALIEAKFLCANPDGTYVRLTEENIYSRPHNAKASVGVERRLKAS
jgi:hypothetical protein